MKNMIKFLCTLMVTLMIVGCGAEKVENKVVTVQLPNNKTLTGVYTGEMRSDKPDGNGIFKTQDEKGAKYTYTGQFKKGMYNGAAILQYDDGGRIETVFKDGVKNGKTKMFSNNVLIFDGDMVNDKANGKGKSYDSENGKLKYDGEWKDGKWDGEGTVYKEDGTVRYKGKHVYGLPVVTPVKMNETVAFDNLQYSVTGTKTFDTLNGKKPEGVYKVVYLTIKNIGTQVRSGLFPKLDLGFFLISDDKGRIFVSNYDVLKAYHSQFNKHNDRSDAYVFSRLGGLYPGKTIPDYFIVMDIPKDAKDLKLWAIDGVYEAPPIALQDNAPVTEQKPEQKDEQKPEQKSEQKTGEQNAGQKGAKPAPDNAAIPIKIADAYHSSADQEGNYVHSAKLAVDGDTKTCWTEGVKGYGIGENIEINFTGTCKVSGMYIWIGHQKNKSLFYQNGRPVALRVVGSDGSSEVYNLKDYFGVQRVEFKQPIYVNKVKLVVVEVARGNQYEDTCIAEVKFF